jgi:hypothetical protein
MTIVDQNRARRHHILPQSYLRRFASEEKVYVLDFTLGKSYRTNISNAACVDDFYTVETTENPDDDCVEQKFLASIEGLPGPIVDSIVKDLSVPQGYDWAVLANYLALMYVRGPWFRQIIQNAYTDLARKMAEWLHSDRRIWQEAMSQLEKDTGRTATMEFDEALMAYKNCEIRTRIPRNLWVEQMMLTASDLVAVFQKMTPSLLYIPVWSDASFITGDMPIQPIARTRNPPPDWKWRENPEADLFFPLSSRRCLLLNYDQKSRVLSVSRKQVALVNHVMALNCTRIVVSQESDFVWLREGGTISKSNEELIEFVHNTPESGPVRGDGWNVLRGEQ